MPTLRFANAETLAVTDTWKNESNTERMARIEEAIGANGPMFNQKISVIEVKDDGQVIVRLLEPVSARERGALLMDLEDMLKKTVDPGLAVWLEALGDRSSLRNLRGIEVKAS